MNPYGKCPLGHCFTYHYRVYIIKKDFSSVYKYKVLCLMVNLFEYMKE